MLLLSFAASLNLAKIRFERVADGDAFDPHDFNMPPSASCTLAWLYYALLGR